MKYFFSSERNVRLVGVPLVALISMAVYYDGQANDLTNISIRFLVSLAFTFSLWEGNRAIIMGLRRVYPHSEQTARRLFIEVIGCVVFTVVATFAIDALFGLVGHTVCETGEHWFMVFSNLIPTAIVVSIYEGAYFFSEWVKNLKQAETLAKENIRSQFEVLKSQLDPHFLFNSMNTLAALIEPDNTDAQKYLEQLSDVYRYVLLSRQKETVSLAEELEFVQSYIFLNKTRYRNNLIVENDIPEESLKRQVAPLSLQILVENALKHNVISKDKPLTLRITVDRYGYVVVENNVQKKNILEMEKSTKTGLQNIINRYALLTPSPVEINQSAELFSVRIPLIAS
ncbi:sensor histidine kinase [Tunicatimonas pelagia]|uniref:sensor histidine kinase n=1 Tax=Tunicatimonas pelagia TaxID=931531 RepID=UPI002666DE05|nr:histidine kinase [Tunicatimonas pelagia]WKN41017.1 histidine kinase [Tunicatimonas pelagia]